MPSSDQTGRGPEELLAGADRPRPLPPGLRARLAEVLEERGRGPREVALKGVGGANRGRPGAGEGSAAERPKALPVAARGRLETSLSTQARTRRDRGPKWLPVLGVAAAVAALAAVGVPRLVDQGRTVSSATRSPAVSNAPVEPKTHPAARSGQVRAGNTPSHAQRQGASNAFGAAGRPSAKPPAKQPAGNQAQKAAKRLAGRAKGAAAPSVYAAAGGGPQVGGLSPGSGPSAGGNWVVVRGNGLTGATAVLFGTVASTRVEVLTAKELRVRAPAHAPGVVEVVVQVPGGKSPPSVADRYAFK